MNLRLPGQRIKSLIRKVGLRAEIAWWHARSVGPHSQISKTGPSKLTNLRHKFCCSEHVAKRACLSAEIAWWHARYVNPHSQVFKTGPSTSLFSRELLVVEYVSRPISPLSRWFRDKTALFRRMGQLVQVVRRRDPVISSLA